MGGHLRADGKYTDPMEAIVKAVTGEDYAGKARYEIKALQDRVAGLVIEYTRHYPPLGVFVDESELIWYQAMESGPNRVECYTVAPPLLTEIKE